MTRAVLQWERIPHEAPSAGAIADAAQGRRYMVRRAAPRVKSFVCMLNGVRFGTACSTLDEAKSACEREEAQRRG